MPRNGSHHDDEAPGSASPRAQADDGLDGEEGEVEVQIVSNPFGVGLDISEEVEQLTKERVELLGALQRTQADFENYKKRVDRQQAELRDRANERIVERMLPALDAFAMARDHLEEGEVSAETKALLQAASLFEDALAKEGLERIVAKGVAFDPTSHEAVEHRDSDGQDPEDEKVDGPVVDEIYRPGYIWKGRVLRPAMVRVRG